MGIVDHRCNVAARKLGVGDDFKWFRWECLDNKEDVMVTGCISSGVYTKGRNKGQPKYDGEAKRVVVTEAERLAEYASYEAETGNCGTCAGDGKRFAGWHHVTGNKWADCPFCNATGKAPVRA